MESNAALINAVAAMARSKGCSSAQISLAWLLAQGEDVFPLVGTKTVARLNENMDAALVTLSADELSQLSALPRLEVKCSVFAFLQTLTRFCCVRDCDTRRTFMLRRTTPGCYRNAPVYSEFIKMLCRCPS
jgi:hypothetical protein